MFDNKENRRASNKIQIDNGLFLIPLSALLLASISLLSVILWILTRSLLPEIFDIGFLIIVITLGSVANVFSYASIITYYKDAEALKEIDAEWVPLWWAYAIATVFFGIIVVPIYCVQRVRYTSADWVPTRYM